MNDLLLIRRVLILLVALGGVLGFLIGVGVGGNGSILRQVTKPLPLLAILIEILLIKSYYSKLIAIALVLSVAGSQRCFQILTPHKSKTIRIIYNSQKYYQVTYNFRLFWYSSYRRCGT
jgi:hypothetical protein